MIRKGKKTQIEVDELIARITPAQSLDSIKDSALVIEVIIEDLEIKRKVLADIEAICSEEAIIATIPLLFLSQHWPQSCGARKKWWACIFLTRLRFSSWLKWSPVYKLIRVWLKQYMTLPWSGAKRPVYAKSTPGFIVNRVARSFYAEGLRSVTEQVASVATIDTIMRSCGGFKMGPLQLIDLIGQDVNCAVSQSVYAAYFQDKRFLPSVLQAEMVAAGLLGKKSGRGFMIIHKRYLMQRSLHQQRLPTA